MSSRTYWYVCDCAVGGHSVCVYSFAYGVGTLVNIAVCLEQLYHWFFFCVGALGGGDDDGSSKTPFFCPLKE